MNKFHFTQEQLTKVAKLSDVDVQWLNGYRGAQNKLGVAYQLCYVKLFNRLPAQSPFEMIEELATFVAVQLAIPREQLSVYAAQKSTFFRHQIDIRTYLQIEKLTKYTEAKLQTYLFYQAQQIQQTES